MKKSTIILSLLLILTCAAQSQLLFKPLAANPLEARIGSMYQIDDEKLRLDIGAAVDLLKYEPGELSALHFGAEFMTYTRLRSEGNFKFPVETTDFYFGLNSTYLTPMSNGDNISMRFRLAHISAHLVDGWLDSPAQLDDIYVYSREFLDITGAYTFNQAFGELRFYTGLNLIFSTIPDDITSLQPQLGFDYEVIINKHFNFTGGADVKYTGESAQKFPLAIQTGILWKASEHAGISLNYYGYFGSSLHGLFFRKSDNYNAIGFEIRYY